MANSKNGVMPNNTMKFKPKASQKITCPGWYDFDVEKAKYKEETDILVLYGIPSRVGSDGNRIYYERIYVCVSSKYFGSGEADPIEELFDALDLNIHQEVSVGYFVGKRIRIYISPSPSSTGSMFYNAEGFMACNGNDSEEEATA